MYSGELGLVEIVSFDMACTLFWEHGCDPNYPERPARRIFDKIIELVVELGYNVDLRHDPWRLYYDLWRETISRGPTRELWHKYILAKLLYRLGAEIDHSLLEKIYRLYIEERARNFYLLPGTVNILEHLKARGYRIILTTGTGAHDLSLRILERTGTSNYFSMVFSTQLVGVPKSDHRFYQEVIDTLRVDPSRIVHIGDSLSHDIYPARKTGLKTIYYGWRTKCRAVDPGPCITGLNDIVYLL